MLEHSFKKIINNGIGIYFLFFIIGLIIGFSKLFNIELNEKELVMSKQVSTIILKNSFIVLMIFISVFFTMVYIKAVFAINGLILGAYIGMILQYNVDLILLILPHGILEVAYLLSVSWMTKYDKKYFLSNIKKHIILFGLYEIIIVIVALIEVYITPKIYIIFGR